jgi:phenylacetate-coenzyme A ligase PaaK-like adenylate-forming protein
MQAICQLSHVLRLQFCCEHDHPTPERSLQGNAPPIARVVTYRTLLRKDAEMFSTIKFAFNIIKQSHISRWSPTEIERLQQRRLRRLVRHAATRSRYYRGKYAHVRLDEFDLTDLPTVDKSELMAHFDDVVTDRALRQDEVQAFMDEPRNLGKFFRRRYALSHTSGTQGRPMIIVQDQCDLALLFALQFGRGNAGRRVSIA